jgi:hypothetical protein
MVRLPRRAIIGAGVIATLFVGVMWTSLSQRPSLPSIPPSQQTHDLMLLSARGYESRGYWYVQGRVTNTSGRSMHNVLVVASWYDKHGRFIKTSEALIGHNPILPRFTSGFMTVTRADSISTFTLAFKTARGDLLRVVDQRSSATRNQVTPATRRAGQSS